MKAATWLLTNDRAGQCFLVLHIDQCSTNQRTSMVDVHRQLEENSRDLEESGTDQRLPVQGVAVQAIHSSSVGFRSAALGQVYSAEKVPMPRKPL